MAAGFTVRRERLDAFREAFNAAARAVLTADDLVPRQRIDVILPLAAMDDDLERLLRHLEPCGPGNPGPVLGVQGAQARNVMLAGSNHLRFVLDDGTSRLGAIAFGWADRVADEWWREPVDVALKLERNEWRGQSTLQGRVVHLRVGTACASSPASSAAGA
jgi:single-stranded-DNA-specific exonuclease